MPETLYLKWNDYQSNVTKSLNEFRQACDFFDVTLVSDDKEQIPAHKLVLSTCSKYFKTVLKQNKINSHLLLCLQGISSIELNNMLEYIYNGEIRISQDKLHRFFEIAEQFELDGLVGAQNLGEDGYTEDEPQDNESQDDNCEKDVEMNKYEHNVSGSIRVKEVTNKIATKTETKVKFSVDQINDPLNQIERIGSNKFSCKLCGKVNERKRHALEHIDSHFDGLSYSCEKCGETFRKRGALRKHMNKCNN